MAMGSFDEINSFVGKFTNLWKSGRDASLQFEAHAGQACVVLRLGLGEHPDRVFQEKQFKKKVSPCQQRRRERRAAARVMSTENVEKKASDRETETINNVVDKISDEVHTNNDNANITEDVDDITDVEAEEAETKDDMGSDCDVYTFTYWDNEKSSVAQEAINYIEDKLKEKFKKNKVVESDQIFKIFNIERVEENELQLKVKMRKNNWPVEKSARNVQTSGQNDPVSVSVKSIQR